MDVKGMFKMMKAFFRDYFHYRQELGRQDQFIKKYAQIKNLKVNPHWMFSTNLKIWLTESEKMFGRRYCPCFEPSGDKGLDKKLICPCAFAEEEIKENGTCHCVLFGRGDLSSEDFKKAEAHLMEEYQGVPLNLVNGILDTRKVPVEKKRGLKVPDSLHQVKRALNAIGNKELKVLVEKEQEAENLQKFAKIKNLDYQKEQTQDGYLVTLKIK
ncbi:ferredoxin-thioredoxin reductase catalytic domain-containing protein [Carboxydothermus pertinax]|uniref:Uncharacterized protein n=1 Tax=Carboxydothermus pertinax TaxID=870242 RepID=A0A1L8CUZ8_9THEO|nr:ferredoxin-thioredoxin reductase catalytic domain-containing protein [Carboxydothermus pertinax]GAV22746.1 hypothetical protein cpu_12560 [Carboxydothermus pertinax]